MSSLIRPLEDVASCEIPYWLPPGGRDNGVWADTWELIADLDSDAAATVLDLLAEGDIGGYVAVPGGRRARASDRSSSPSGSTRCNTAAPRMC